MIILTDFGGMLSFFIRSYMAPEMVAMMNSSAPPKPMYGDKHDAHNAAAPTVPLPRKPLHYTKTVDWWSLGVTLYKLLVGVRPFQDKHYCEFMDMVNKSKHDRQSDAPEYAALFQKIGAQYY